jgi:hypothetical protein
MKIYELHIYNCGAIGRHQSSMEHKKHLLKLERQNYESACEMALNKHNRGPEQ